MTNNEERDRGLVRQEVEELTDLLRRSAEWRDLRQTLESRGIKPEDVLLATFYEDEEENEYGIFVNVDRRVFEYKRSTRRGAKPQFLQWRERTGDEEILREYPQIVEALALLSQ
jgi:hypothetical protein